LPDSDDERLAKTNKRLKRENDVLKKRNAELE
jgi:hypothetical protein